MGCSNVNALDLQEAKVAHEFVTPRTSGASVNYGNIAFSNNGHELFLVMRVHRSVLSKQFFGSEHFAQLQFWMALIGDFHMDYSEALVGIVQAITR